MSTLYILLKAFLDPVVPILILLIVGLLASFRSEKMRYPRIIFLTAFIILYIGSVSPVSNALSYILEREYLMRHNGNAGKLDIVVVLGGGVSDNKYIGSTLPSYQTTSRLFHAIQVFRDSEAEYLVVSGKGSGEISEAEVMAKAAEGLGVPAARIKVDSTSRNTWEHAQNLNNMFQYKDIKIGLVTSAYHMKRSEREFKKYFPNVIALPSDYLYSSPKLSIVTFMPRSGNLYKVATVLNEMTGNVWYRIRKRIAHENPLS